ncbi:hypothetical protein EHH44_02265 [Mycolicibacter terrae]|uniref:Transmembrane protein n=2 Tax=Mycolicibacter TaxID=1073531 RepID=A0A1A2NYQ7_MYCSD|nr:MULTISPECIES: hypothetical protein [Mycolicibacter]OBH20218.1 hypothetical protein A5694_16665 [Mycolicibacter sinensis]OBI33232.1 hypothetical protein A5710_01935 [Mycolicibacter sinensis]RRR48203.1 hypothetical protein EHH44_02265 [Mycolicibacter terrae]
MHKVTLASTGEPMMLTVGLSIYAALVLASIAVAIDSARRRRRRRAICASVMVGILTLGGLVAAIFSSVA